MRHIITTVAVVLLALATLPARAQAPKPRPATTRAATLPVSGAALKLGPDAPEALRAIVANQPKWRAERAADLRQRLAQATERLRGYQRGRVDGMAEVVKTDGAGVFVFPSRESQAQAIADLQGKVAEMRAAMRSDAIIWPALQRAEDFKVGAMGTIQFVRVVSVVDERNVIAEAGTIRTAVQLLDGGRAAAQRDEPGPGVPVWLTDWDTAGLVDGRGFAATGTPFHIIGTTTYQTAEGQRTVLKAASLKLGAYRE